jgi:hypothetical protein
MNNGCDTVSSVELSSTKPSSKKGSRTGKVGVPILITAVGVGWLLTAQGMMPGVQWAWVIGVATLGAVLLSFEGVNKFSFVVGPSLILGAFLSILRQAGFVGVDTEVPVLTISVGVLWTVANLLLLPTPSWIISE